MTNTSTAAMNHCIRDNSPKQFHEPTTVSRRAHRCKNQYVYVEQSSYILSGKTRSVSKRVRVSPSGKLVFLQQFDVLH